jgi:hypothetical protein
VSAFRIAFETGTDRGIFEVKIDGLLPNDVTLGLTAEGDSFTGSAGNVAAGLIDCYATTFEEVFAGWRGLNGGQHTIRVTKKGTKNAASSAYKIRHWGIEHVPVGRCDEVVLLPPAGDFVSPDDASVVYTGTWATVNDTRAKRGILKRSSVDPPTLEKFVITTPALGAGVILYFTTDANQGNVDVLLKQGTTTIRTFVLALVNDHGVGGMRMRKLVIDGLAPNVYTITVTRRNETGRWDGGGGKQCTFEGYRFLYSADPLSTYGSLALVGERKIEPGAAISGALPVGAVAVRQLVAFLDNTGTIQFATITPETVGLPAITVDGACPVAVLQQKIAGREIWIKQSIGPTPDNIANVQNERSFLAEYRHYLPCGAEGAMYRAAGATAGALLVDDLLASIVVWVPRGAKWITCRIDQSGPNTPIKGIIRVRRSNTPQPHFTWSHQFVSSQIQVSIPADDLPEGYYRVEWLAKETATSGSRTWTIEALEVGQRPGRHAVMAHPV